MTTKSKKMVKVPTISGGGALAKTTTRPKPCDTIARDMWTTKRKGALADGKVIRGTKRYT
jgi:hypothetical protein